MVWLQLTLVLVKPLYFLKTTIGDAENLKDISGSPSYSVSEQRLSSRECSTSLCLQRQLHKWCHKTSYKTEGTLDYGVHFFFCINRGGTHSPTDLGWGFLHQFVIETA